MNQKRISRHFAFFRNQGSKIRDLNSNQKETVFQDVLSRLLSFKIPAGDIENMSLEEAIERAWIR